MGKRKTVAQLEAEVAELNVRLTAANLQLAYWKEAARGLENNVRMWMAMHNDAMQTMARLGEAPPDFEAQRARVTAALDAPGPGVEALIMAVSLASARDLRSLAAKLPQLAPSFMGLLRGLPKKLPRPAKVQEVKGAQAERIL